MDRLGGLAVIALGGYGMYLQSQGKLLPVLSALTTSSGESDIPIGKWLLALVVFLFVLTLIPPKDGMILTIVLLLGGWTYQTQKGTSR